MREGAKTSSESLKQGSRGHSSSEASYRLFDFELLKSKV